MQITDQQQLELIERLINGIHRNQAIMLSHTIKFVLQKYEHSIREQIGSFGIELLEELLEETPN